MRRLLNRLCNSLDRIVQLAALVVQLKPLCKMFPHWAKCCAIMLQPSSNSLVYHGWRRIGNCRLHQAIAVDWPLRPSMSHDSSFEFHRLFTVASGHKDTRSSRRARAEHSPYHDLRDCRVGEAIRRSEMSTEVPL